MVPFIWRICQKPATIRFKFHSFRIAKLVSKVLLLFHFSRIMKTPSCFTLAVVSLIVLATRAHGEFPGPTLETTYHDDYTTLPEESTDKASADVATTTFQKKRGRKLKNMPINELKSVIKQVINGVEAARRDCNNGFFYNLEMETCNDCDTYCTSHEDLSRCGIECRGFFKTRELAEKLSSSDSTAHSLRLGVIVGSSLLGLVFILLIVVLVKSYKMTKKMKKIKKMIHDKASGDKSTKGTSESEESLLTNASEESGDGQTNPQQPNQA